MKFDDFDTQIQSDEYERQYEEFLKEQDQKYYEALEKEYKDYLFDKRIFDFAAQHSS